MQWLMRFRILWGIHKSFHNIHPAPSQLRCRSLSEIGAPRWNDYEVPEEFNFASCVLDYWAQMEKEGKRGPNPAFWWVNGQGDEVKWSFREIADLTRRTANILTQTCGLQQGDLLALILPRVPEWWLVAVGCMRTGIIFMPATIMLKAKDILYRLQMSKAKGIVTTDTLASDVDSMASECPSLKTKLLVSDHSREGWLDFRSLVKSASPEHTCIKSKTMDPMVIFFTSGTTGFPKMAKHSHGLALQPSFPASRKIRSLKTSDVSWCLSDSGWILATMGTLVEPWTAGCTVFIHHLPQFDTKVIIQVRRLNFHYQQNSRKKSMFPGQKLDLAKKKNNILLSKEAYEPKMILCLGFSKCEALNLSHYTRVTSNRDLEENAYYRAIHQTCRSAFVDLGPRMCILKN